MTSGSSLEEEFLRLGLVDKVVAESIVAKTLTVATIIGLASCGVGSSYGWNIIALIQI